jgi:hypothetical protein
MSADQKPPLAVVPPDAGQIIADLNFARDFLDALVRHARKTTPETWLGKTLDDAERAFGGIDRACQFALRGGK